MAIITEGKEALAKIGELPKEYICPICGASSYLRKDTCRLCGAALERVELEYIAFGTGPEETVRWAATYACSSRSG